MPRAPTPTGGGRINTVVKLWDEINLAQASAALGRKLSSLEYVNVGRDNPPPAGVGAPALLGHRPA